MLERNKNARSLENANMHSIKTEFFPIKFANLNLLVIQIFVVSHFFKTLLNGLF